MITSNNEPQNNKHHNQTNNGKDDMLAQSSDNKWTLAHNIIGLQGKESENAEELLNNLTLFIESQQPYALAKIYGMSMLIISGQKAY
ncbi:UNKNOWN [Stylonychia lemnae]|uniref:Uncharacterized protein n=1 Tax=Stylonychia lemnae TaxID=5949 RepID=A0A078AMZ7_STYLE|nr:UNKNOWN [Stylonychia lemnae]|eukprot:CDW83745.1 UNKNOWN [Stylonychia lemnae]